jgi:hypothetical protein
MDIYIFIYMSVFLSLHSSIICLTFSSWQTQLLHLGPISEQEDKLSGNLPSTRGEREMCILHKQIVGEHEPCCGSK